MPKQKDGTSWTRREAPKFSGMDEEAIKETNPATGLPWGAPDPSIEPIEIEHGTGSEMIASSPGGASGPSAGGSTAGGGTTGGSGSAGGGGARGGSGSAGGSTGGTGA